MVTFGEINRLCHGRIIPKKQMNRDYILGDDEITDGSIFPLFKLNEENPLLTINGIKLNHSDNISIEDVSIVYQVLDKIEIKLEKDYFTSSGGSMTLNSIATFNIMEHNVKDGYVDKEIKTIHGNIKPIYHIDNPIFTLNKNIISVGMNLQDEEKSTNITIAYRYGKITKDAICCLKQLPNSISDWKIERIIDKKITLTSNIDNVPKNGGVCDLKVIKESVKYYYKEDTNGHVLNEKKSETIYEDVTSLCKFKTHDIAFVEIIGNHVVMKQQKEGTEPRDTVIYAEFGDLNASVTLFQEGGGVVTYRYETFFPATDSNNHTVILPTSLKCDGFIPFHAFSYKLVDGEVVGKIGVPMYNISCDTTNNEWCCVDIMKSPTSNDGVYDVFFDVFNNNPSKTQSREFTFKIICADTQILTMTIVQPPLQIIAESVSMELSGETIYNTNNIKKAYIDFIPYKITTYEDDSYQKEICLDDTNYFDYECVMSKQNVLTPKSLYKSNFNGIHTLLFSFDEENLQGQDMEMHLEGRMFSKEGKFLCASTPLDICYHNKVIVEEYEFKIDDALTYTWKSDWNDKITIDVISRLNRNEDGEITHKDIPFTISGNTPHFDVQVHDKGLEIFPKSKNLTTQDFHEKIYVIQNHTNDIITLDLTQTHHEEENLIIKLNVIVHVDDIMDEIWSSESTLFISQGDDVLYTMYLSPCWLYEGNNEDIIYQGYIALKTNTEYNFKTTYFKIQQPTNMNKNNYNINEMITFNNEDKEITLFIDL